MNEPGINLLEPVLVAGFRHHFSFHLLFFLLGDGFIIAEAAEEGMFFGSPFVGNHLVEVPGQQQVKNDIDEKTNKSVPDHIWVDNLSEIGSDLEGLAVEHGSKGKDNTDMRDQTDNSVDCDWGVVLVDDHEGEDELHQEEKQRDEHSYFGSGQKGLDEEVLDYQHDVEHKEHHEGHVEGDILELDGQDDGTQQMHNEVDGKVADKPAEVVVDSPHPHDEHTFPDFGLNSLISTSF